MVEVQPLKNDRYRVFITPEEFQVLIDSAPHHRAIPPMQIMALSARVGTAADATPSQICKKNGEYFISVEGKDSTDRYQETKARDIWIPSQIHKQIEEFISRHNTSDNGTICDVEKRQLQNWVKSAGENAAQASGKEDFAKISAHDLRRYFATHFLIRLGVGQQLVAQLGGWKSPANMYEYLLIPNDLLVHRLTKQGYTGTNPLHLSGIDPMDEINSNISTVERIITQEGDEIKKRAKDRIKELVEEFDSLKVTQIQTDSDSEMNSSNKTSTDGDLTSFNEFSNDD